MGVSTNWYTIYGVKISYNDQFAEEYDEVYRDKDTHLFFWIAMKENILFSE